MAKQKKDPLLEALKEGRSYTWTVPEGGDLASMRKAIRHGQTLTMSPVQNPAEIRVDDLVLVRWHQGDIFHIVGEIREGQFLIVNSLGKVNGWVEAAEILGRITKIVEPEPRPSVEGMLAELEAAYRILVEADRACEEEVQQFSAIIQDLRWYAGRIGQERLDVMPRANQWSFAQNLWRLTRQAKKAAAPVPKRVLYFIDRGKACVGAASDIFALFEYEQAG